MIDEYGEGLYPDLRKYFDIDLVEVIAGRGPAPSLVILCVQDLPDTSLTWALIRGGRQFIGWGQDRHMLADLYDAINVNSQVSGRWAKKAPDFPDYPRPNSTNEEEKPKKVSVADLWRRFNRR